MYIKNLIQQNIEYTEKIGQFRNNILKTDLKYDITNCVLCYEGQLKNGYLTDLKTYKTITDAIDNITNINEALYFDGKTYNVCNVKTSIMDCDGKYIDISKI